MEFEEIIRKRTAIRKFSDEKILREEFDIPSEYTPYLLMPLGYKAEDCPMNPLHNKRKGIEELVEYK